MFFYVQERTSQIQKALNLEKLSNPSELSELRQQMRENLSKKSSEAAEDVTSKFKRILRPDV